MDRFARLAAPLQFGCLKGKGVCEAHLPLRLHLHIGASYRMATAVIFVDIRAAYYTVVKEFFFDSAPEDGMHALRGLFGRLNLPEAALDDFISTVVDTNLLDAARRSTSAAAADTEHYHRFLVSDSRIRPDLRTSYGNQAGRSLGRRFVCLRDEQRALRSLHGVPS